MAAISNPGCTCQWHAVLPTLTWKPPSGLSMPRSPPRPTTWQVAGQGRAEHRKHADVQAGPEMLACMPPPPPPSVVGPPALVCWLCDVHHRLSDNRLTPVLWAHCPARMVAREGQQTAKLVMSAAGQQGRQVAAGQVGWRQTRERRPELLAKPTAAHQQGRHAGF